MTRLPPIPWTAETYTALGEVAETGWTVKAGDDSVAEIAHSQGWTGPQTKALASLFAASPELASAATDFIAAIHACDSPSEAAHTARDFAVRFAVIVRTHKLKDIKYG